MRRVLNNSELTKRSRERPRLSFSSPSRRTQAGIPREMFYSGTPRASAARTETSCCSSMSRLNALAQVAATAICIQSTLIRLQSRRKSIGAPTSPYPRRKRTPPFSRIRWSSMDACCANYCRLDSMCFEFRAHCATGALAGSMWRLYRFAEWTQKYANL